MLLFYLETDNLFTSQKHDLKIKRQNKISNFALFTSNEYTFLKKSGIF